MTIEQQITAAAEAKIKAMGGFLVSLKVHANRKILIEFDKPEGVKISDCAELSRALNHDPELLAVFESHELEVGSPGMDNPFRVYEQYVKNIGRKIKVKMLEEGEISGKLNSVMPEGIELEPIAEKKAAPAPARFIPFNTIKEARKIISFS